MKSDLDGLAAREANDRTINARVNDPRFIECLKRICMGQSVRGACGSSKMPRRTLYDWMEEDPEIKKLVDEAKDQGLGS